MVTCVFGYKLRGEFLIIGLLDKTKESC